MNTNKGSTSFKLMFILLFLSVAGNLYLMNLVDSNLVITQSETISSNDLHLQTLVSIDHKIMTIKEQELKLADLKRDNISIESKIKSQESISDTLETIIKKKTAGAIKILSGITDEERRLEVAKVHADLITRLGKKVNYAELLEKLKR